MEGNELQSWRRLVSIYGCGAISLPVIMIGQEVALQSGWLAAAAAILIGNGFLLLLGLASSAMAVTTRKSTAEIILQFFGKKGAALLAQIFILCMLAWFAIQLNVMALGLLQNFSWPAATGTSFVACNIFIGLVITVLAGYGIKAIGYLANLSMPLLLASIAAASFMAESSSTGLENTASWLTPVGISLVMAASIAVVVDMPTVFRLAHNKREGALAAGLYFGIILPLVEGIGVYLAVANPDASIVAALSRPEGGLWNIWIAIFLLLSGWTVNNSNLYSAAVSMQVALPRMALGKRTWLAGMIGTTLACCNPLLHLSAVLNLLGIAVGSIGGSLITAYLLCGKGEAPSAGWMLLGWASGLLMGNCVMLEWAGISGSALLDAYVASAGVTAFMCAIVQYRRKNAPAYTG